MTETNFYHYIGKDEYGDIVCYIKDAYGDIILECKTFPTTNNL